MRFYCSYCGKLTKSLVDRSCSCDREADYTYGLVEGVHLFGRKRVCQECEHSFDTVEVHETYLSDFFRLRQEHLQLLQRINVGLQTVSDVSHYFMLLNSREIIKQKLYYRLQSYLNCSRSVLRNQLGEKDLHRWEDLILILPTILHQELRFANQWNEELRRVDVSRQNVEQLYGCRAGQETITELDLRETLATTMRHLTWEVAQTLSEKLRPLEEWPLDREVVLFEGLFYRDLSTAIKDLISAVAPYLEAWPEEQKRSYPLDVAQVQSGQLDDVVLVERLSVGDLPEGVRAIMALFAEHKRLDQKLGQLAKSIGTSLANLTALFTLDVD